MLIRLVTVLLVLLLGGTAQAGVVTDCVDACFSGFNCTMREANGLSLHDCQTGRQHCVDQCNKVGDHGRSELPPAGIYGAIAYDKKSGAWGISDTSPDEKSAKKSALDYCKQHGNKCEIVESFSKSCGAVAAGSDKRFGWAVNASPRQASLDAIKKCGIKNASDNRCYMQMYHCYPQ